MISTYFVGKPTDHPLFLESYYLDITLICIYFLVSSLISPVAGQLEK